MPYLSKEKTSEVRKELKVRFPDFKFSVRNRHAMALNIAVLEGPLTFFNKEHFSVNPYYIESHYEGEELEFLLGIKEIATRDVYEETYDGDYGSVPSYYVDISIGQWDRPYKIKK